MDSLDPTQKKSHAAELLVAVALTIFAIFLLGMITSQVKYFHSKPFYKQPGLWAGIGLVGMVLSGIFYTIMLWIKRFRLSNKQPSFSTELKLWASSVEYFAWFMGYVFSVPWIGYLAATIMLSLLLTIRLGYRKLKFYLAAVFTATAIVVIFKSLLQVKIPGAAVYEYLPDTIRNFFILNL